MYERRPRHAAILRTARRARGWTQAEMARRVGVSADMVRAYEAGRRPGPWVLERLAAALELDAEWLRPAGAVPEPPPRA